MTQMPFSRRHRWAFTFLFVATLFIVSGCGRSTPVPTLPPPPPTAAATDTPTFVPPTATSAPTVVAAAATATIASTETPTAEAATPVLEALAPTQDWVVRSLKVGPGRTYAFLAAATPGQPEGDYHLLFTDDDGQTWAPFPGGLPAVACINRVDLDYANQDALFAGACDGGLYRWNGSAWELLSDQRVGVVEVVYQRPDDIWAADSAAGLVEAKVLHSGDGGRTWARADSGIGTDVVTNLGIDPRDGSTMYALGADLYQGNTDGQWQVLPTRNIMTGVLTGIAIEGGNGALYVSEAGATGRIWRSENANAPDVQAVRWGITREFEGQAVQLLATGPSSSGLALYANLADTEAIEGGISVGDWLPYRSLDGGATWERIVIPGWLE